MFDALALAEIEKLYIFLFLILRGYCAVDFLLLVPRLGEIISLLLQSKEFGNSTYLAYSSVLKSAQVFLIVQAPRTNFHSLGMTVNNSLI